MMILLFRSAEGPGKVCLIDLNKTKHELMMLYRLDDQVSIDQCVFREAKFAQKF